MLDLRSPSVSETVDWLRRCIRKLNLLMCFTWAFLSFFGTLSPSPLCQILCLDAFFRSPWGRIFDIQKYQISEQTVSKQQSEADILPCQPLLLWRNPLATSFVKLLLFSPKTLAAWHVGENFIVRILQNTETARLQSRFSCLIAPTFARWHYQRETTTRRGIAFSSLLYMHIMYTKYAHVCTELPSWFVETGCSR